MSNLTKELHDALRAMMAAYWGDGDGQDPPQFIKDAQAAIEKAAPLFQARNTRDNEIIDIARTDHGSDEVEIDDDAEISEGDDNGAFVQAWVWASFSGYHGLDKDGEEETDEEEGEAANV